MQRIYVYVPDFIDLHEVSFLCNIHLGTSFYRGPVPMCCWANANFI